MQGDSERSLGRRPLALAPLLRDRQDSLPQGLLAQSTVRPSSLVVSAVYSKAVYFGLLLSCQPCALRLDLAGLARLSGVFVALTSTLS